MSQSECGNCARPVGDGAAICTTCTTGLAAQLRGVPDLVDDLLIALAKQDRIASGGKRGKGAEQPLPVRLDITPVIHALGNELTTWARDLVDRNGWDVPDPPRRRPHNAVKPNIPDVGARNLRRGEVGRGLGEAVLPATTAQLDLIAYAAGWLADHVEYLRTHPAATEAHQGITGAIEAAQSAVDRPERLLYVGECALPVDTGKAEPVVCSAPLYAPRDAAGIKCESCGGYVTDIAQRWDRALFRLRGYPATAADIAGWVSDVYSVAIKRKRVNDWHYRGTLKKVDDDPDTGDPRFRIGEVLDRAARSKPRKAG